MALVFNPTNSEFKRIGDIWKRAVQKTTNKAGSIIFENTRKSVNLVDFNETRITSSTWATADKTKGFEIIADIYGKSIGNTLGGNENCFGVFVPCKKGESVSIDFFNYEPYYGRCFYCEVDADFKVLTKPVQYSNGQSALTQKTFTATSNNCIGFAIEWYISAAQTRNYTKENYMVVKGSTVPTAYYPYFSPTKVMSSLKAYGGTVQEIAPKLWGRYKPVEYIESTGTQYIDTGFTPDNNTRVVCRYKCNDTSTTNNLFGARSQTTTRAFTYGIENTGKKRVGWNTATTGYTAEDTNWHTVDMDGKNLVVKVDGSVLTNLTSATFTAPTTMLVLGIHATSGFDVYFAKYQVANTIIYDNGTLIHNFLPVLDSQTNTYGMFDTVTETFYGNSGTGSFTAGPEIKPVDYIENTANSCINTGIYLSGDHHKAEVRYQADAVSGNSTLFGTQNNQNLMTLFNGSGYACGDSTVGVSGRVTTGVYTAGTHTVSFEMANNEAIYIFDSGTPRVISISASTFNDSYLADSNPVYVFANNNRGVVTQRHVGKIYYFKFWKSGVLIRHFIPVKLGTEYCMFDLVSWTVFRNEGTGTFTGGSEIPLRLLYPYDLKCNLGEIRYDSTSGLHADGEHKVTISGKNLFNKSTATNGYTKSDGTVEVVEWYKVSDYIYVSGFENITLSNTTGSTSSIRHYCFYDAAKNFISSQQESNHAITMTVPPNAKYIRIPVSPSCLDICQVEKGSTALPYEPYIEPIKIDITEILPSATSYIDEQTGTLYKDWGIKVLDGTESYTWNNPSIGLRWTEMENLKTGIAPICNTLEGSTSIGPEKIIVHSSTGFRFRLTGATGTDDVKSFIAEQYAKGTPIILIYPLATPTTETKSTTPVSLTTKGSKTIASEAEIPTTVDATYLGM